MHDFQGALAHCAPCVFVSSVMFQDPAPPSNYIFIRLAPLQSSNKLPRRLAAVCVAEQAAVFTTIYLRNQTPTRVSSTQTPQQTSFRNVLCQLPNRCQAVLSNDCFLSAKGPAVASLQRHALHLPVRTRPSKERLFVSFPLDDIDRLFR